MPANVATMFSVKETPWHGLGHVLVDAPTIADAIKLAGADWQIVIESLYRNNQETVDDFVRAFVRSDTNKVLGVVGNKTHPLQNEDAFKFFEPFIEAGECFMETGGVLGEGEKVWVMAKINRDNNVVRKGDEIVKYMLVSNSHDGSTAVRVGFTPVRVVCANTLAMAHSDKSSKLIRVRHSKSVKQNVERVRDIMNAADADFEATAEEFRVLARRDINQNDLRKYVKTVFDMEEDDSKLATRTRNTLDRIIEIHNENVGIVRELLAAAKQEEVQAKVNANIMEAIFENMETGRGTNDVKSAGSWWDAYNAVNEYLNYERGNSPETRLESLWFGPNAKANNDALVTALKMSE